MPSDDLLKDFMKRTDARLNKIDENVLSLIKFRWLVMGGAAASSFLFTVIFELAKAIAGGR